MVQFVIIRNKNLNLYQKQDNKNLILLNVIWHDRNNDHRTMFRFFLFL